MRLLSIFLSVKLRKMQQTIKTERQVKKLENRNKKFQETALDKAIEILNKKRLTPIDYLKLKLLTKIIFDVNTYNIQLLTDRLYRSQSYGAAFQAQPSQQKSEENSTDLHAE